MFDPITYMQTVQTELKLTATKYHFARVSGVSALEEVLDNYKREKFFFAIDDAQDGITFRGAGAGYFERRNYTVYILGRAKYGDMDQRTEILTEAKTIFRSILTRLIKDKLSIPILSAEQIRFFEVPPAFAFGTAGLYFMFTVENPVDLQYNGTDWQT